MKLRNLLIGAGSVLDLCPATDVRSIKLTLPDDDGFRQDYEALRSDWEAVGNTMREVMKFKRD